MAGMSDTGNLMGKLAVFGEAHTMEDVGDPSSSSKKAVFEGNSGVLHVLRYRLLNQ